MRRTHLLVLAIVAVAVVLAIGAVGAYADITSDSQAPVTTTDAVTQYWNTVAIKATATDDEGVAYVYNRVDGGPVRLTVVANGPTSYDVSIPVAQDMPLSAGEHTLRYWAQDVNGNVEAQNVVTFTVAVDTDKPETTLTGAKNGAWYKAAVMVHLAAADVAGGSDVKDLTYSLDGEADVVVSDGSAAADITVPAVGGAHTIVYHATDVAGNVEDAKTVTINVDVTRPATSASAVSARRGRKATLRFKVTDTGVSAGTANVVIKIRNSRGRVVTTVKRGVVGVNTSATAKFTCKLAKGKYKYTVYAKDAAGNAQSKAGTARLTVR